MFALILLVLLAVWIFADYGREARARRMDDERRAKKATLRRVLLAREPESPASFERLGDALREADDPSEAIACYEEALELRRSIPGDTASFGLENKLRLARLEQNERDHPRPIWANPRDTTAGLPNLRGTFAATGGCLRTLRHSPCRRWLLGNATTARTARGDCA